MPFVPSKSLSIRRILKKLTIERVKPHTKPTLISFQITLKISFKSISLRESARMIVALAWPPELPPVSMSIGINAVSTMSADSLSSNEVIIIPVNVALIIKRRSQGIRDLNVSKMPILRYGFSVVRTMAFILWISSVFSSCNTSIASSNVIIPTSLSSISTTGSARKLYLSKRLAAISLSSWVFTKMIFVSIKSSILSS